MLLPHEVCPRDWPGAHPVGTVVVMGWMDQRIHNYCGRNISAGHIEGISQPWATQLPNYLGIMGCSSWGVNSQVCLHVWLCDAGVGQEILGLEWMVWIWRYKSLTSLVVIWPRTRGNWKISQMEKATFFFFRGYFLDGHLGICLYAPCATLFKTRGI